jgi:hypothetical protein
MKPWTSSFTLTGTFNAARDGTLTIDPNAKVSIDEPPTSDSVKASLTSINPVSGTDYVRINPIVSSAGGSGSIAPAGVGVSTNVPGNFVTSSFTMNLHVKDIPSPPSPKGKVTIGPISALRTYDVLFPPPKNRKGQDAVSSPQERDLIRWYQGLNDRTKEQVRAGLIPISLEGHASTTGDFAMNRELSNSRMENVKRILGQFAGNRAIFEFRSVGKYEARTPDEIESQEERKVVVSVWEQISEGGSPAGSTSP